ncbi:putative reverse transcriptase domain-containing protein [Tanacetum coccineum]
MGQSLSMGMLMRCRDIYLSIWQRRLKTLTANHEKGASYAWLLGGDSVIDKDKVVSPFKLVSFVEQVCITPMKDYQMETDDPLLKSVSIDENNSSDYGTNQSILVMSMVLMKEADPKVKAFANVVKGANGAANNDNTKKKINIRTLISEDKVENSDFVLPIESIQIVKTSLLIHLAWKEFGFQKIMRDDDGFFYFKFESNKGMEQFLNKKVPVWVKMLKVLVVAYTEDGLSRITSQIGRPIMVDSFTSETVCNLGSYNRVCSYINGPNGNHCGKSSKTKGGGYRLSPIEDGAECILLKELNLIYEWKTSTLFRMSKCLGMIQNCSYTKKAYEAVKPTLFFGLETSNKMGYTLRLTHTKKKTKNQANVQPKQFGGLKLNKPTSTMVWNKKATQARRVEKGESPNAQNHKDKPATNRFKMYSSAPKADDIVLKNSFSQLVENAEVEWGDDQTWGNAKHAVSTINDSDSEEVDEDN